MQPKVAAVLLIVLMGLAARAVSARELWVAPDGNDQHTGAKDQPLATPDAARQTVRRWIAAGLG